MNPSPELLGAALVSMVIGLVIFIFFRLLSKNQQFSIPIGWLFIALFPPMILFAFFPASSASGTFLGITLTGAIMVVPSVKTVAGHK